jgi:DNA modification methylase
LLFRKPGENKTPIQPDINNEQWIEWARPIWYGIRESDTLQYTTAREEKDERHICPLQLDVIERCIHLWSNPNDLVFSPFTGIGSEGYVALKAGRRFVGTELKKSYFDIAVGNLRESAGENVNQLDLFAEAI